MHLATFIDPIVEESNTNLLLRVIKSTMETLNVPFDEAVQITKLNDDEIAHCKVYLKEHKDKLEKK